MAKKQNNKNKVYNIMTFIVIAAFLFVGYQFSRQYMRYIDINAELSDCRNELASAEREYAELCEQKDLLYTDTYIEFIARKNLGMIREGEKLVQQTVAGDAVTMDADFNYKDYLH